MNRIIKIGTRGSKLALWQAERVHELLNGIGLTAEVVPVKSQGDLDLVTPIYAMDVQGVFTKTLDAHLLSGKIDIAVHSMKDVPTQLAQGIVQAAVLKRADPADIFIPNPNKKDTKTIHATDSETQFVVASGSVRRRAQWLHHFPNTRFETLRGNVQTRMRKLSESDWDGIIMAKAGLERVNELPERYELIDWMISAPAQGAILVVCREDDAILKNKLHQLNDSGTALSSKIERDFLKTLMGGCSTPIAAFAQKEGNKMKFKGNIVSPDGKDEMEIGLESEFSDADDLGIKAANQLLEQGAGRIVEEIRNNPPA